MKKEGVNWPQVKISEIADFIDCVNRTAPIVEGPTEYKMLRTTNIRNGRIDTLNVRYVTEEIFNKWTRRGAPKKFDVILTREAPLGEVGIIRDSEKLFLGQRLVQYRANSERLNPLFLYYSMQASYIQNQLRGFGSGSTVEHIRLPDCQKFLVPLPPLSVQANIASILSAYDNLIENNTRRIAILEDMARLIYREWFVHFRFPGHEKVKFVDSPIGKIPQGWEVVRVDSLLKRLKQKEKYTEKDVEIVGEVPVIDQSTSDVLGYHNNVADFIPSLEIPVAIFGDHTCKMQILLEPFSIGPNVIPFITNNDLPLHYVFYLISNTVETREYKRHWNDLIQKEVLCANHNIATAFAKQMTSLFMMKNNLSKQNINLRQTRDLLLPRVISGEIDVSKMDID